MLYPNSDASNPLEAIGVVLGPAPVGKTGATVLIARASAKAGETIFIKDINRPLPARLTEPKTIEVATA
jgi:hypothetical protein